MSSNPYVANVQAEMLARIHYGLPPYSDTLTGHTRGCRKTLLQRLRTTGLIDNQGVTADGYAELRETVRLMQRRNV